MEDQAFCPPINHREVLQPRSAPPTEVYALTVGEVIDPTMPWTNEAFA